jgi:hypothetical protein
VGSFLCGGRCCPQGSTCNNGVCECNPSQNTLLSPYTEDVTTICCPGLNAKFCDGGTAGLKDACCSSAGKCAFDGVSACCEPTTGVFIPSLSRCCPLGSDFCYRDHGPTGIYPDRCEHCVKGLPNPLNPGRSDEVFCCDGPNWKWVNRQCCATNRVCDASECYAAAGLCKTYSGPGGSLATTCCDTRTATLVDGVGCCSGLSAVNCGGQCCSGTCGSYTIPGQPTTHVCCAPGETLVTERNRIKRCCPGEGALSCNGACCSAGETCNFLPHRASAAVTPARTR